MAELIIAGLIMGLAGSFHCVGMCGPLALSLPLQEKATGKLAGVLLYNAGRVVTYSAWGLVFGLIGQTVAFFGFQQYLSIAIGIALLLVLAIPGMQAGMKTKTVWAGHLFVKLRHAIGSLFSRKTQSTLFIIGLLNGMLPCGLVYMAVAAAIASGSWQGSIGFMAAFGLGTFPMMMGVAFFGSYLGVGIRKRIRSIYPYMIVAMACLLIVRGMGLGVPYLSPSVSFNGKTVHSCCTRHS